MELFEIQTKNRVQRVLHKIVLATGIVAIIYLLIQLIEGYFNNKKPSSSRK